MNEVWLASSAVAGLVVALATVWRIVARATHTLRGEIGDLRGEIGDLRGQIGDMGGQIGTLQVKTDEIGPLRAEIGDLRGEIGDLRSQIGDMGGQIGTLQVKTEGIGTLRAEINRDTKREIDMLRENDLRHLAEGIKGLDTRIDRVEVRVTESIGGLERRMAASVAGSRPIRALTLSGESTSRNVRLDRAASRSRSVVARMVM